VSFDHLLKDQGAVVDKGSLSKLVDGSLSCFSGSIPKKGTQKLLERGQVGGKIGRHAEVGEVSATGACKVVWDVFQLESRGKLGLEVAGISEPTAIKPTGRTR